MNLAPRPGHLFTKEGFYHLIVGLALLVALLALYRTLGEPLGTPPVVSVNKTVPTTGSAGYPVAAFCEDDLTKVAKAILPPDSTFKESYTLDRIKAGVHETITVNTYPDPAKEPVAVHYDSANNPQDGFVSKAALDCVKAKAK